MPAPNKLTTGISAVDYLIKSEASYGKELREQEESLQRYEEDFSKGILHDGENSEYMIRQRRLAIQETKRVYDVDVKAKIKTRAEELEATLKETGDAAPEEQVAKAKGLLEAAKKVSTYGQGQATS